MSNRANDISPVDARPLRALRSEAAAIIGFFSVLTLLFTYPIWTRPNTYLTDLADVRLVAWIMAWDAHALVSEPSRLFDTNIFYPNLGTLAYSETFLGQGIAAAPLNWLGYPVMAYNVVLLLTFALSGIGAALWVRHLTGSLPAGLLAGLVWAFAPGKFDQISHLHMLSGQWIPFALLAATRWVESRRPRYLYGVAIFSGLQFAFSMHYGVYLVPTLALYVLALIALGGESERRGVSLGDARHLVAAGALYGALVLPIALPYLSVAAGDGPDRTYEEMIEYSGQPTSYLAGSRVNRAPSVEAMYERYGRPEANYLVGTLPLLLMAVALVGSVAAAAGWRAPESSNDADDQDAATSALGGIRARVHGVAIAVAVAAGLLHVAGLLVAGLSAGSDRGGLADLVVNLCWAASPAMWLAIAMTLALATSPRRAAGASRNAARVGACAYLATMFYLLSYGPEVHFGGELLGFGPYWLLYRWAPAFEGIRAVGRIGLMYVLFAGALAGFTLAALSRRVRAPRLRHVLPLVVLVMVTWEYRVWPLPRGDADPAADPVYAWLAQQPGDFPVVHVPLEPGDTPWRETRYMLGSTLHWKPLVNGYSGYFPRDYRSLAATRMLSEEFFRVLRAQYDVRYLVAHRDLLFRQREFDELERLLQRNDDARFVEQVGDAYVFEVPRDTDRGSFIRRRYLADRLAQSAGIQFLVRASPEATRSDVVVLAGWGDEREVFEVGTDWSGTRVPLPAGFADAPSDEYFTVRAHQLVPLGGTGAMIASGFTADVQAEGSGVGIDVTWLYQTNERGFGVHVLDRYGTRLESSRHFPATADGERAAVEYVATLPDGAMVAMTIATAEFRPMAAALVDAVRSIGGEPVTERPLAQMVVVGRVGADVGSALQSDHQNWAFVDIEVEAPSVELRGIGLY